MSNVQDWSTSAASNNSASPDGAPEGMAPSGVNNTMRENMAAVARWFGDTNGSLTSGGAANAYTLTSNSSLSALSDGDTFMFEANHTNSGAATLAVDGLTAQTITLGDGTALSGGEIVSGGRYLVSYDLANTDFRLVNMNDALDTEGVQDIVGGMVTGNTETGIDVTYQDGDGTLDFALSTTGLSAMTVAPAGTDEFLINDGGTMKTMSYNEVALPSTNDSNAHTFVSTDVGAIRYFTGTSATWTMNSGIGQNNCWIIVINSGSGTLTLASGTATILSANSLLDIPSGGTAVLIRESSTVWFASGSLQ